MRRLGAGKVAALMLFMTGQALAGRRNRNSTVTDSEAHPQGLYALGKALDIDGCVCYRAVVHCSKEVHSVGCLCGSNSTSWMHASMDDAKPARLWLTVPHMQEGGGPRTVGEQGEPGGERGLQLRHDGLQLQGVGEVVQVSAHIHPVASVFCDVETDGRLSRRGLRRQYEKKGFTVLAFPSNDFKNQEPGTEAEIKALVTKKFKVTFPMFSKIHVSGSDVHPVFKVGDWSMDERGWLTRGAVTTARTCGDLCD
jgi:hypothetical protein